jgi:lipopolysaccharide export system permease protein|tara:strand:+ start:328 stop:1452 length:1125 start_codon:yes stop_codon:yes gene_type:complete
MKNTIYKYFVSEFTRYFVTTLFALSAIVWTVQAVNYLDLVIDDGHAFTIYFFYSFLNISKVLTKLIPFCFLIATILTILKMEKDNELIVLWTSGLNKIHIVNQIIRVSLIIMFLQLTLTVLVNPKLLNLSRSILKNSELQFVSSMFKEKKFNDTVEGLTIFIDEKMDNGVYKNVFIKDEGKILSSIGTKSSTIFAKLGYVSDDEKNLILLNGSIQKLSPDGTINIVNFEKTSFNLAGISTKSISEPKMQETSTLKIIKCIKGERINMHNCNATKKTSMDIKIEFNKRIGMPLFIPLIALVCCFLLSSRRDETIYNLNKYIYFFIGFIILLVAEITVRYSGTSLNHATIYYLIPFVFIPIIYYTLIRKFKYENLY